ncbi:MAG: Uma2 family endonuclease [Planctomycetota bacterium]|nr:Uma2 family endonuclease [Planctomycetaceae bacterium]MDQ3329594.1 Uma2 family endonuclease [Planctomycetota bacterium]
MSSVPHTSATLDDLYRVDGKAELIGGRIVSLMPTGRRPNLVGGRIYRNLAAYIDELGRGEAYTDNMGFVVSELSSGRQSFSPDVSFYDGPFPRNEMRFIDGPPTFAVEVRREGDYGAAAEEELAAKRADYFEAGTEVVWDVDPVADLVRVYRASTPDSPALLRRGQIADAEPAVSGWQVSVDHVFG